MKFLLFAAVFGLVSQTTLAADCPNTPGVVFLPDEDCTKYYICSNGTPTEMECPSDLFFNPDGNQCDFPEKVPECVDGTRPPVQETEPTAIPSDPPSTTTTGTTQAPTSGPTQPPTSGPTGQPPTTTSRPPGTMNECGQSWTGNTGVIEYKLNENYQERERCTFTVRTLNHTGFIFTLEEHGITEDTYIYFGAISIFGFGSEGHLDTVHLGPPNPLAQAYVAGAVAVVMFRTENLNGTGFKLTYTAIGEWTDGDTSRFEVGTDISRSEVPGGIKYPPTTYYNNNEQSIFIISNNFQKTENALIYLNLQVSNASVVGCTETCFCDALTVYSFLDNTLSEFGRLCSDSRDHTYNSRGVYILHFKTDREVVDTGFNLSWKLVNLMKDQITYDNDVHALEIN